MIHQAGFTDVVFTDVSSAWGGFVKERTAMYRHGKERNLRVHGESIVNNMQVQFCIVLSVLKFVGIWFWNVVRIETLAFVSFVYKAPFFIFNGRLRSIV